MTKRSESDSIDLLERLTLAAGPSGAEGDVRQKVRQALKKLQGAELCHDRLGSLIIEKKGSAEAPRVLLDAHLDEVGFLVQHIGSDGMLALAPLGGWWGHVLLAQRVDVLTERGKVPGIIGSRPPHFLSAAERDRVIKIDKMFVDVGARDKDEAIEFGIQIGDAIAPHCEFIPLSNPRLLSSKAFDDRAGVGLLVESLLALADGGHPNTLVGVAAVQEEIGCRGAGTAAALARPDVGVILEGTPADDTPGFPAASRQACLGEGPQIRFSDPTALSNRPLVRLVQSLAEKHDIPYQVAVRRSGGTDAKSVHLHAEGVPTVVIGVPARYIHTHVSIIDLDDYFHARQLVVELCKALDAETVAALTQY
jgi:putative aminopeptidase FrvX